jgi:hypothetical protein
LGVGVLESVGSQSDPLQEVEYLAAPVPEASRFLVTKVTS